MNSLTEGTATCDTCGLPIYLYTHSRMGSLRAQAWTDVDPDGEVDPRWGTRCASTFQPHKPTTDDLEGDY